MRSPPPRLGENLYNSGCDFTRMQTTRGTGKDKAACFREQGELANAMEFYRCPFRGEVVERPPLTHVCEPLDLSGVTPPGKSTTL